MLQAAIELKVDLILVQEPWLTPRDPILGYTNTRSIAHPSFTQVLPRIAIGDLRPRTLAYIARGFRIETTLIPIEDPDLLVLNIGGLELLNIYNQDPQLARGPRTLEWSVYPRALSPRAIVLGDFNTHHPQWDPLASESQGARELVQWVESKDLALLNTPGIGTFYRPNLVRPSVLDLTFATRAIESIIRDWQVLPDLGSDHFRVLFTILGESSLVNNPLASAKFNLKLANQDLFNTTLKEAIKEA